MNVQINVRGVLLALLLVLLTAAGAFASAPSVVDEAGLLSKDDVQKIAQRIGQVESKYNVRIGVVTKKSIGGKNVGSFANHLVDTDYAGASGGAIVLLIVMDSRDWYISTDNAMRKVVTDEFGYEQVADAMLPDLKEGHYASAFAAYADEVDTQLAFYQENGRPMKASDTYGGVLILGALLGAAVITFIVRRVLIAQMSNVAPELTASAYLKDGSFHLDKSDDTFLYTDVKRVPRPKQQSSSSSGSSSRDSSHGGGGGKF